MERNTLVGIELYLEVPPRICAFRFGDLMVSCLYLYNPFIVL